MKASIGIFTGTIVLVLIMLSHILYIPPLGTDSLIYHLTIPAFWIQNGLFSSIDLPFHDAAAEYSPMLTQLMQYVLLRMFSSDSYFWAVQIVFGFFVYFFYFKSCRLILKNTYIAMLLTSCVLLFPPFISSLEIANNDMALTCGSAWMLYGMVLLSEGYERKAVVNTFCGISLLLLVKTVGIIYSFAGILSFLLLLFAFNKVKAIMKLSNMLIVIILLIVGLLFYIKNWIVFNNPLYPVAVSFPGIIDFKGVYNSSNFFDLKHTLPDKIYLTLFSGDGTFNLKYPLNFILWASFFLFGFTVFAKVKKRIMLLPYLVFFLLSAFLFFSMVPFWYECRLVFPLYYSLWVFVPFSLKIFTFKKDEQGQCIVQGIIIFAILILELFTGDLLQNPYVLGFYAVLILISLLFAIKNLSRLNPVLSYLSISTVCLAFFFWYAVNNSLLQSIENRQEIAAGYYERYYGELGEGWNFIDKITLGHQSNIAYSGTPIIFPLFGYALQNKLFYIPISQADNISSIKLNGLANRDPHSIYKVLAEKRRQTINDSYWLSSLKEKKIDLIFLDDQTQVDGVSQELGVIARNPKLFSIIYKKGNISIYNCSFF